MTHVPSEIQPPVVVIALESLLSSYMVDRAVELDAPHKCSDLRFNNRARTGTANFLEGIPIFLLRDRFLQDFNLSRAPSAFGYHIANQSGQSHVTSALLSKAIGTVLGVEFDQHDSIFELIWTLRSNMR